MAIYPGGYCNLERPACAGCADLPDAGEISGVLGLGKTQGEIVDFMVSLPARKFLPSAAVYSASPSVYFRRPRTSTPRNPLQTFAKNFPMCLQQNHKIIL